MIALNILGAEGTILKIVKGIYVTHIIKITFKDETLDNFL